LIGSTLRSRTDVFKGELINQLTEKVWPLFTSGALNPQVEEVFAWTDAEAAFARLASNQVNGKIVLQISQE
jgi:NADPH:quinone reductase-like Zn-dependent oxidoreductase